MKLPPPRPLLGSLRALDSATTAVRMLDDGRYQATISHAPLMGVTPAMLVWFLKNMSRTLEFGGLNVQLYLWWHPLDHVALHVVRRAGDGQVGAGAAFNIREVFQRDPRWTVDEIVEVPRLDEGGITLERYFLGQRVFELAHTFTPVAGGTQYDSVMTIGTTTPWLRPLANALRRRRFPEEKQRVWLRHNVEEVGYFEHFLPSLYERYGHEKPS